MSEQFNITFRPSGRGKARCPADPKHPNGIMVDLAGCEKGCAADLPYPAPECGLWFVNCNKCGLTVAVTAAGRTDDPRCAIVPCKSKNEC